METAYSGSYRAATMEMAEIPICLHYGSFPYLPLCFLRRNPEKGRRKVDQKRSEQNRNSLPPVMSSKFFEISCRVAKRQVANLGKVQKSVILLNCSNSGM